MFPVQYPPNEPIYFLDFLPPGSGSTSVHADPDPEGISLCGSGSETLFEREKNAWQCQALQIN